MVPKSQQKATPVLLFPDPVRSIVCLWSCSSACGNPKQFGGEEEKVRSRGNRPAARKRAGAAVPSYERQCRTNTNPNRSHKRGRRHDPAEPSVGSLGHNRESEREAMVEMLGRRKRFQLSLPLWVRLWQQLTASPRKKIHLTEETITENISSAGCYFYLSKKPALGSRALMEITVPGQAVIPLKRLSSGVRCR